MALVVRREIRNEPRITYHQAESDVQLHYPPVLPYVYYQSITALLEARALSVSSAWSFTMRLCSRCRTRRTCLLLLVFFCLAWLSTTAADERPHRRTSRRTLAVGDPAERLTWAGVEPRRSVSDERLHMRTVRRELEGDEEPEHLVWDSVEPYQSVPHKHASSRAADDTASREQSAGPTSRMFASLEGPEAASFETTQPRREALSASQVDSQLLHELDRLIELHQKKVNVLLRMQQDAQHTATTSFGHAAVDRTFEYTQPAQPSADSTSSPGDSPIGPHTTTQPRPRHSHQRTSSSSSEPFTFSSALPQLVQRALVFLAAIAVLVVYQYVQHKRSQRSTTNTSRAWEDEWLARRRRREALDQQQHGSQQRAVKAQDGVGMRRWRVVAEVGGERGDHSEEGKELRVESEVYEQRDSVEWDEAEADFYDASASRHDGYAGVFGVEDEDDEKEAEEEETAMGGGGIVEDDANDDDEYQDEEEPPDDDEQG